MHRKCSGWWTRRGGFIGCRSIACATCTKTANESGTGRQRHNEGAEVTSAARIRSPVRQRKNKTTMKNTTRDEETLALTRHVRIPAGRAHLEGELKIPAGAAGVVLFAHGSGSSRHSPRNQFVARVIRDSGTGTLLFDLLTREEELEDNITARLRFDIDLLARRLAQATRWVTTQPETPLLGVGYFGSSTCGGAALVADAELCKGFDAV